jgi:hypothetical protein
MIEHGRLKWKFPFDMHSIVVGYCRRGGARPASQDPDASALVAALEAWMAQTLRSLLPRLEAGGLIDVAKLGAKSLDSLEERIREAVTSARSQVGFAQQYCAWTKV